MIYYLRKQVCKMAKVDVKCPECGGTQVYKHGTSENGEQRYICRAPDCATQTFRLDYRYEGSKPGIEEKIIAMAANASGIRDTARVLGISTDKVMDTLKKRMN
jgi:transposase-like protein